MFEEELIRITGLLHLSHSEGLLKNFCLIGGVAVSILSSPRATADIDFAIQIEKERVLKLAERVKGSWVKGDPHDPLEGVIRIENSIPSQLVVFPDQINGFLFRNIGQISYKDLNIPVASRISLILLKLYAGGAQDFADAKAILSIQPLSSEEKIFIRQKLRDLKIDENTLETLD